MPDVLAEGRVLTLRLERRDVSRNLGSILQAGNSGFADSTETGAMLQFGLRERRTALAQRGGETRVVQHLRVGGSRLAHHIGGLMPLDNLATQGGNGVNIGYFRHRD